MGAKNIEKHLYTALKTMEVSQSYQRFYEVIARIPAGKVATYGQVAALAGYPGQARQVGYALHATPEGFDLPWQRVINAKGEISPRANPAYEAIQRKLLAAEGIGFDAHGHISLAIYQWHPETG